MRSRMSLAVAALTLALLTVTGGMASAANSVQIGEVTVSAGTATVTGTAVFPPITAAESVVGDEANTGSFSIQDVSNAAGLNLVDAKILPINGGLRFIWEVNNMPAQVPPEGVRYNWAVMIGTNTYQLQAKRTSLASVNTIEDPKGHIEQAAGQKNFFQLRGNCVSNYFPPPAPTVNGCYHYAFLNGAFDLANKQITMDWPYETRDAINRIVAPDFKPGVTLTHCGQPYESGNCPKSAGMSIAASFQAVVSNQTVSNFINNWDPYYAGPRVQLAVGSFASDPTQLTYGPALTLTGTTFSGSIGGITAGSNTVFARACNGATCAYAQQRAL